MSSNRKKKLSLSQKILLVVSYGFVALGLICVWAGDRWGRHNRGYMGIDILLFLLAIAFLSIGWLNTKRILNEQRKDKNPDDSKPKKKLSLSRKVLLVVSYGFIPFGLVCVWAGIWWRQHAGGFLGIDILLYLLAVALPVIGWLNAKRISNEQRKDTNPDTSVGLIEGRKK